MTVKDLKQVFEGLDETMEVYNSNYLKTEINGWFFETKGNKQVLVLTDLNVQPR